MRFEYTYSGKLLREITDKEKEIANLKNEVSDLIDKQDFFYLKKKYQNLINEIEGFEEFRKIRINKAEQYLVKEFYGLIDEMKSANLKDKEGRSLTLALTNIGFDVLSKRFYDIINETEFNSVIMPAIITSEYCTEEDKEFIQELYDYVGISVNEFYRSDIFDKFSYNLKIKCFKDTVQEAYDNIRECLREGCTDTELFCMLTGMLSDEDIRNYIQQKFCVERDNLKIIAEAIREYYLTIEDALDETDNKPKEITEFIDAVCMCSKTEIINDIYER